MRGHSDHAVGPKITLMRAYTLDLIIMYTLASTIFGPESVALKHISTTCGIELNVPYCLAGPARVTEA